MIQTRQIDERLIASTAQCQSDYQREQLYQWQLGVLGPVLGERDEYIGLEQCSELVRGLCQHWEAPQVDVRQTNNELVAEMWLSDGFTLEGHYAEDHTAIFISGEEALMSVVVHEFAHHWTMNSLQVLQNASNQVISWITPHGGIFATAYAQTLSYVFEEPLVRVLESMMAYPLNVSPKPTELVLGLFNSLDLSVFGKEVQECLYALVEWDHGLRFKGGYSVDTLDNLF